MIITYDLSGKITACYHAPREEVIPILPTNSVYLETDSLVTHETHYVDVVSKSIKAFTDAQMEERLRKPDLHRWNYETHRWEDTRSKDEVRSAIWAAAKVLRRGIENGGFVWNGLSFDSNQDSRNRLLSAGSIPPDSPDYTPSIEWTLKDNTTAYLTRLELAEAHHKVTENISMLHKTFSNLRREIFRADKEPIMYGPTSSKVSKLVEWDREFWLYRIPEN